jgi:hypothetical protein
MYISGRRKICDNLLLIGDHLANLIYIKEQLEKKLKCPN